MENATLTENLLEFVFLKLPDNLVNIPYNSTFISLRTIIRLTTLPQVVTRVVYCGVSIEEDDIMAAAIAIPDSKVALLELILTHCDVPDEDAYQSCINTACNNALATNKKASVLTFMRHGATPSPDRLGQIPGLYDEPLVKKYFEILYTIHDTKLKSKDGDDCVELNKMKVFFF